MANKRGRPKKIKVGEVRFGDELDTTEKRKQAVALIHNGKNSSFWEIISKILDYNIAETERIILEDDSLTPEERENWRRWRYYQLELKNLPDNLIREYNPEENPIVPNPDPYE